MNKTDDRKCVRKKKKKHCYPSSRSTGNILNFFVQPTSGAIFNLKKGGKTKNKNKKRQRGKWQKVGR